MADQVLGIKDRKEYGSLSPIKPGDVLDYVRQLHEAERAGTHYDFRIGNKDLGLLSWATRKDYPERGKSIELFRQPVHSYWYRKFQGRIPIGYGKGKVTKADEGKILITKKDGEHLSFTTATEQSAKRYALIPTNHNAILVRAKGPKNPGVKKPKFKNVPTSRLEAYIQKLDKDDIVQPKIDGALTLFHLLKNKDIEVLSHRTSKRTGDPIWHTERFFGKRPSLPDLPKEYADTVLLGEMYGEHKGTAVAPQILGGILNSNIAKSLERQKKENVQLKAMLFDVPKFKGKSTLDMPYEKRYELLKEIKPYLVNSGKFTLPEIAKGPEEGQTLLKKITQRKHPLTAEGVIVRKADGTSAKAKLFEEYDVYIRDIFPGEGKFTGKAAGGFWYSLSPEGKVVGKCGTGFTDQLRKDMWKTPHLYLGRVARIKAQGQYKDSGAYRAPALIAIHESK